MTGVSDLSISLSLPLLAITVNFIRTVTTRSDENYIIYSCSKYRDKQSEIGIKFNDKELKVKWPIKKPILSKKDKNNISFAEYKKKYL